MKPNFALDLSHDGINLLHRGASGWSLVGSVALDDPDLIGRLADLRKTAAQLSSSGFTTKLVIPNSQVLYTVVDAPGPDDIAREVQIRAALDGVTPYPVGELVFDWRAEGNQARVAVVARETLDEAEAFAADNKLNPVSFVARPGRGDMSGEPFFGKTKEAAKLLSPGERVEPDKKALPKLPKSNGQAEEAEAEPDHHEVAQPVVDPTPPAIETPAPQPEPAPIPELGDPFAELDALAEELSGAFDEKSSADTTPPTTNAKAETTPSKREPRRKVSEKTTPPALAPFPPTPGEIAEDMAASAPKAKSPRAKRPTETRKPVTAPDSAAAKPTPKPTTPVAEPSAKSTDTPILGGKGDAPTQAPPREETSVSASPKDTPSPAFSSRRASPNTTPVDTADETPEAPVPERPKSGFSATPDIPAPSGTANSGAPFSRIHADMADALSKPLPRPDRPVQPAPEKPGFASRIGGALGNAIPRRAPSDVTAPSKTTTPAKPPAEPAEKPTKRGFSLSRRRKDPDREAEEARRAKEAEALTVFGARKSQEIGGKPRYLGLILTLLLLLIMAVIVVWSSFFVQDGQVSLFNPGPDVASVTPDVEANVPASPDTPAEIEPIALPDPTVEEDVAQAEPDAQPVEDPAVTASVVSMEDATAFYDNTGIWQRAPEALTGPDQSSLTDHALAVLANAPTRRDVGDLPEVTPDANFNIARAAPIPPPSPGTNFALDENGLIEPQPDGALSPAGVLVYAGKPDLVPPQRPITETATETAANDTAEADTATDETPTDNPDLIRPEPRPSDLVTDGNAEAPEESDAMADMIANAAIDDAISDAIADPFVGATELAVANTHAPSHRPANFASIVANTQISASDGSVASAAPAPAPATVSAIPTSASVAAQATTENALNLRRINVIGIYGTANARRALVRLANGRYVRVKVGDRLDGGQVTSISANQLTYQKGNRAFKLDVLPLG